MKLAIVSVPKILYRQTMVDTLKSVEERYIIATNKSPEFITQEVKDIGFLLNLVYLYRDSVNEEEIYEEEG